MATDHAERVRLYLAARKVFHVRPGVIGSVRGFDGTEPIERDLTDTDLASILDELKHLRDEAVELRVIRDSRVREVRAAFAAGWLDHGEIIAERLQLGHEAREKAGQAYATVRIADWSADPDQACQACGRDFGLPYVKRYRSTGRCEDCSGQQPERDGGTT